MLVNITSATTTQVSGKSNGIAIQVNASLTGAITVIDNTTGSTPVIATITNPTVGSYFQYRGKFNTGVRITTSATCDITIATDGGQGVY